MAHVTRRSALALTSAALLARPRRAAAAGNVLRYADVGEPSTLNPWLATTETELRAAALYMGYLARTGPGGRGVVPDLAAALPTRANGGVSADGRRVTYRLRPGLRWSDGTPLTSADVAFTYQAIRDAQLASPVGVLKFIDAVQAPDPLTVVLRLHAPYADTVAEFMVSRFGGCVLPRHLLGGAADLRRDDYNNAPVGAGPFRVREYRHGDRLRLEVNPFAPHGRPPLDGIDWHILASSANAASTAEAQLRTGEVDLIVNVPVDVREHLGRDGFQTVQVPVDGVTVLELNHRNPHLARREVRAALRMATDRRAIAAKAIRAPIQETLDSSVDPAFVELPFVERDVRAASDLLDRAGLRRDARGTRFTLAFVYVESPRNAATVELIRADWAEIGVAIETRHVDLTIYLGPKDRGGILRGGHYDVGIVGRSPIAGVAAMDGWFGCRPGNGNWNNYCSPRIDSLIADAYGALEERREIGTMRAVYRQLDHDVPAITLSPRTQSYAANRAVRGFRPHSLMSFDDVSALALQAS